MSGRYSNLVIGGVSIPEGCILTAGGRWVNPVLMTVHDISIDDIAAALSRIQRYTGHTSVPYTVAQHSMLVSLVAGHAAVNMGLPAREVDRISLWGLLHDAAEAYISDIPGPLKASAKCAGLRDVEDRIQKAVQRKFYLEGIEEAFVRAADLEMLKYEMLTIMPLKAAATVYPFAGGTEADLIWRERNPDEIRARFLDMYEDFNRGVCCIDHAEAGKARESFFEQWCEAPAP